jgi:hypothetical protein
MFFFRFFFVFFFFVLLSEYAVQMLTLHIYMCDQVHMYRQIAKRTSISLKRHAIHTITVF